MKATTYARYSSDKQRETSIEDQVRNCLAYAKREGWDVVTQYADRAMSGTKTDRPDYQAMLANAEAGQFEVLIVDDLARLSRDDIEVRTSIRRLRFLGIRLIGVSDGFDSDAKGYKIQAGVRGLMNELYLDDLREKTHRGLAGRAHEGLNTGGRCFGYRHIPIESATRKDELGRPEVEAMRREVNPEQAEWVRYIFERYADGRSPRQIADELNRAGVKGARKQPWSGATICGVPATSTGLLNNELYVGRYVWNRSRWETNPDTGRRRRTLRPESEWIATEQPKLRIVSDALWQRVKARQAEQRERSVNVRRALHKNARSGAGPKYIFSSVLKCGVCGANYAIIDAYRYGCSTNVNRGPAACSNGVRVPRKVVESELLAALKNRLFTAEGINLFKAEVRRLLAERRADRGRDAKKVEAELARVEKEIANIVTAIKAGIFTPTTKAALEKAEAERTRLERAAVGPAPGLENIEEMLPRAVDTYRDLIENFEDVVMSRVSEARNQIKALVGREIPLHPTEAGGLEAVIQGDYAGLLAVSEQSPGAKGTGAKLSLVAGARNRRCLQLIEARL